MDNVGLRYITQIAAGLHVHITIHACDYKSMAARWDWLISEKRQFR